MHIRVLRFLAFCLKPNDDNGSGDEPKSYDDELMADVVAALEGDASPDGESGDEPPADAKPDAAAQPKDTGKVADNGQQPDPQAKLDGQQPDKAPDKTKDGQQPPDGQQQPAAAPPSSWSVAAKQAWDKADPALKEAIAKREAEVSAGFAQYQGLKPYQEMARASGKTLPGVLGEYVNLENLLRADADRGFMAVAQNLGLTQAEAAQKFAHLAQRLGFQLANGQQPPQNGDGQWPQPGQDQNGPDPLLHVVQPLLQQQMAPLMQKLQQLEGATVAREQADHSRVATTAAQVVNEFKANPEHRYYANVEPLIAQLLNSGVVRRTGNFAADLKSAYEHACRLDPQVSEALINERQQKAEETRKAAEKEAAEKARLASRSLAGSSPGQPDVSNKRRDGVSYDDDLHADVLAAFEGASGRV